MQTENDTHLERPARRIRRENLHRLMTECGSTRNLAARTGAVETHLIAIQKGRREIGDSLAAKLEAAMGKPFGWMDIEHPVVEGESVEFDRRRSDRREPAPDDQAAGQGA